MSAQALAMGAQAGGTALSAYGTYQQGRMEKKSADFEFAQYLQEASNTRASSQLRAEEERRQGRLMESRANAISAAGGGSDKSTRDIIKGIAGEAEYRALLSIYEGEDKARGLEDKALMRKKEGKSAKKAGTLGAIATILGGGSSIAKSYKMR